MSHKPSRCCRDLEEMRERIEQRIRRYDEYLSLVDRSKDRSISAGDALLELSRAHAQRFAVVLQRAALSQTEREAVGLRQRGDQDGLWELATSYSRTSSCSLKLSSSINSIGDLELTYK
jgi:hypothetical protein